MRLAIILMLLISSCGDGSEDQRYSESWIDRLATSEEIQAFEEVLEAFYEAEVSDPGYRVIFIHTPDDLVRGVPWSSFRLSNTAPRNEAEGYRGFCDRPGRTVYIRRYGEAEPHLHSLLIHELLHAAGYDHGEAMRSKEAEIRRLL